MCNLIMDFRDAGTMDKRIGNSMHGTKRLPAPATADRGSLMKFANLMVAALALLCIAQSNAATYANTSVAFNWIDATGHTKLGPVTGGIYSPLYKFQSATGGCGTAPPILDDTLTDKIPIGFNFMFSGQFFDSLRIMSNGRLQFTRIGAPISDNVTCGFGSPVTQLPYPDPSLNYTMRIYGNDLDPTLSTEVAGYITPCVNRTSCFVSYATVGVAPYRSFVVTWSNVPEWTASGANATGGYNLQIILQENGEFIYQYGTDTPGAGNVNAQVGWQADTVDYAVPSLGFPATNSALKFFIPAPVAEYRMEQPSWNPPLVLDTSGNSRNGTALGLAQSIAAGKVCRGANIPANVAVGTIDAINTGIAMPTTVGGTGTITFWYKGNTAWSGADAQLLDATVVNNQWFYLVRRSTGQLNFAITDSTGVTRVAQTGVIAVAAGTWKHIAVSWNFNALAAPNSDHMIIYVDGVAQVTSAFTTAGTISGTIGTLYIGDNRSAFTVAPGTGNSANGAIDEFRIYNYEGGIALVQRDMNLTQVCLSHYAITDSGVGQTCAVNQVTVTAHDAAHGNVIMPNNTTTITLSTSTALGDWSLISGYGVLNNGTANDGIATYLFNGEYQAVFGLSHATPATVTVSVTDGQITQLENTALVISTCTPGSFNSFETATAAGATSGVIKTKVAGSAFSLAVVAISGGAQMASFSNNVKVELLGNTVLGTPLDVKLCPTSSTVLQTIAAAPIAGGRSNVAFAAVADAWRDVRVRMTYLGVVSCSTDAFAIRPNTLGNFSVRDNDWQTPGTARVLNNTGFANTVHKAGQQFSVRSDALNAAGTPVITNNYAGAPTATLTLCVGAACTAGFGTLALTTSFAAGQLISDVATYSQVGAFSLQFVDSTFASIDSSDGSTAAELNIQSAVIDVGRFVPDHFAVATNAPVFAAGCSSGAFTYVGQRFSYSTAPVITVTAQNASNATTTFYTGTWWRITNASLTGKAYSALSGTLDTSAAPSPDPVIADTGAGTGTLTFSSGAAGFFFTRTVPVAPFNAEIGLAINIVDADAATYATNPATVGAAVAGSGIAFSGGKSARFGRLRLSNANGSELIAMPIPMETQYWNGTGFVTNSVDNCTTITSGNVGLGNYQRNLVAGQTTAAVPAGAFTLGKKTLTLSRPGTGNNGATDVVVNLGSTTAIDATTTCLTWSAPAPTPAPANLSYLQGQWCGANFDRSPTARATFGTYRNTDKFIYQRENF